MEVYTNMSTYMFLSWTMKFLYAIMFGFYIGRGYEELRSPNKIDIWIGWKLLIVITMALMWFMTIFIEIYVWLEIKRDIRSNSRDQDL